MITHNTNPEGKLRNDPLWILMACLAAAMLVLAMTQCIAVKNIKYEAVSRGYAIYNPTNGVWQWQPNK